MKNENKKRGDEAERKPAEDGLRELSLDELCKITGGTIL
jgi:hypothetical protein